MKHRRIVVTDYGGPDVLRVIEEERPKPRPGEVLVRVLAAGVSLPDLMAREGIHPETPRVPFTPGWDLVGVVDRLGDDVSGLIQGEKVAEVKGQPPLRVSIVENKGTRGRVPCGRSFPKRACSVTLVQYDTAFFFWMA